MIQIGENDDEENPNLQVYKNQSIEDITLEQL